MSDQWQLLRRRFLDVSVRIKIMGIVLGTLLLLGAWVTLQARDALGRTMTRELRAEARSLARDLSSHVADYVLTDNVFAVHRMIVDTQTNNPDVLYIVVADPKRRVIAHTMERTPSPELLAANEPPSGADERVLRLNTSGGIVQDAAAAILDGRAGMVRVGVSEIRLHEELSRTTRRFLLATLIASLVGITLAMLVTAILVRPIEELVTVTRAVGSGDFGRQAQAWSHDEIGQLATDFNTMTRSLQRSQQELDAFHAQLMRQNRELSALNAIALAVSQSLELDSVLADALAKVLELTEAAGGRVHLANAEEQVLECRACAGAVEPCAEESARQPLRETALGRVVERRRTVLWNARGTELGVAGPEVVRVGIPLLSSGEVLGVLELEGPQLVPHSAEDVELLTAIGRQIGIAVRNAQLWAELEHREAAHAQLLRATIRAQEDERQRVARELHDQTGQGLTSLMLGLKLLLSHAPDAETRQRVRDLRQTASETLEDVRRLAFELRPTVLDDLGLPGALQRIAEDMGQRLGIAVDCHFADTRELRLSREMETAIYRIVQEALTNIAKHAQARNVSVLLRRRNGSLVAIVEDDGRGFDPASAADDRGDSLGLFGMRERAELVGGKLRIESAPGAGCTVFVDVPIETGSPELATAAAE